VIGASHGTRRAARRPAAAAIDAKCVLDAGETV
jgi:hypothetical protein